MAPYETDMSHIEFLFPSAMQTSSDAAADDEANAPSSFNWPVAEPPKFSSHRGNVSTVTPPPPPTTTTTTTITSLQQESSEDDNSIRKDDSTRGSDKSKRSNSSNQSQSQTRLKDVFSCNKPIGEYPNVTGGDLQVRKNMEVFLDGLVNGFWQCPGLDDDAASSVMSSSTSNNNHNYSTRTSCTDAIQALAQSTQQMEFQFIPTVRSKRSHDVSPPLPSSSAASSPSPAPPKQSTSTSSSSSSAAQAKKATGKMFKRIRVKRGENIGLELFEHSKSVYISKVAKDGIGLKRGMRIIAINDHPCPDSVGEAIVLLGRRAPHDEGYVTFVTGEEYDFENAPSVVGGGGGGGGGDDNCSIQSTSMGYV